MALGGGIPGQLPRGWFIEPTVLAEAARHVAETIAFPATAGRGREFSRQGMKKLRVTYILCK